MTWNIWRMPSWTSPTSRPRAGAFSPKVSSQVAEPLRPILCSMLVHITPLRSPSEPSSLTQNLGTMNIDRPLVPAAWPSGRASTRWMMFSVPSKSPLVMKRLTPSISQMSSLTWRALLRPAPTSLPASGSVSTIEAPQWRSIMFRRKRCFCAGVPRFSITRAITVPSM
jgi:hypothetical protein